MLCFIAAALFAFGTGAAGVLFTDLADILGANLPVVDPTGDYATALAWALLLAATIFAWPVPERDKLHLMALWIVKVATVLLPMLLYEARYSVLDAYSYYAVPQQNFVWEPFELTDGTENLYRLVWLHGWIAPDSFHALKITFSLIGLIAIYLFYRSAACYLGRDDKAVLYALGLFPSILFWSSIVGKEPVVLLGIALYTYGVISSWRRGRWSLWPIVLGAVILSYTRIWLVPILLVALVPLLFSRRWGFGRRLVAMGVIASVVALSVGKVADMFVVVGEDLPAAISRVSQAWADDGGSGQFIDTGFTSFADLAAFLPIGVFTALFRPLVGEVPNAFGLLAGLENLALLGLLALALIRFRRSDLRDPVVLWAIVLVGTWAGVYGFLSYQNLGTAVRFKAQILPIFLCLLLYLSRRWRMLTVFQRGETDRRPGVTAMKEDATSGTPTA